MVKKEKKRPNISQKAIVAYSIAGFSILMGAVFFVAHYSSSHERANAATTGNTVQATVSSTPITTDGTAMNIDTNTSQAVSGVAATALPSKPGLNRFVSTTNNVGFYVDPSVQIGNKVFPETITKNGNKYFISSTSSIADADSFEVFTKTSSDTLAQAITKTVLNGFNPGDCPITENVWSHNSKMEIATFSYAQANTFYPNTAYPKDASKCPINYTEVEGPRFFLMDTAHPDRFTFISSDISITAGTNANGTGKAWYDTLTFF